MRHLLALLGAAALIPALGACGTAPATASPTPGPTATARPSGSPGVSPSAPADSERFVVYFARDRLPPVAARLEAAKAGTAPEARVLARLRLLFVASAPEGLFNVAATTKARPATVAIDGDLATVDFIVPGGDWGTAGSAGTRAFVQQLVYTVTEEPGIRRALFLENGREAIIGGEGLVIDHPVAREDVMGFSFRASTDEIAVGTEPRATPLMVVADVESEVRGHAFTRLVITAQAAGAEAHVPLGFRARAVANDDRVTPALAKWALVVDVPSARTSQSGIRAIDATPARGLRTTTTANAVRFELGLDDLRPWRVAALYDPLRLVIDIGGDPQSVSPNIALYTPAFGTEVRTGYAIAGLVRAFEARFEYRVRDGQGRVVLDEFATASLGTSELWGVFALSLPPVPAGAATIEILLRSPRDGAISESVFTSVVVIGTQAPR